MIETSVSTVRRPAVEYVQRVLTELGAPVEDLVEDGAASVPAAKLYRLWDTAEKATADAAIGLRAGAMVRADDVGLLGSVFEQAPTLGEALIEISRLLPLASDHLRWVLVVNGSRTTFELAVDEPALMHPRAAEHLVSMLGFAVQSRLGGGSFGLTMHWAHPCPMPGADYEAELGMGVQFDAGWNGLSFDTAALRTPGGSEAGIEETRRRAEHALGAVRAPRIVMQVRELISTELASGRPVTEAALARKLGLHPKSLARRLAARGTTFRSIVDAQRQERSRRLLEAGRSVDEVSRCVGYADATAFSRAFKRWTGCTPTAYVAQVRTRDAPADRGG